MLEFYELQQGKIYECLSIKDAKPFFLIDLMEKSNYCFGIKALTQNGIGFYVFSKRDKFREICE